MLADVPITIIWEESDGETWCVLANDHGADLFRSGRIRLWVIRDEVISVFRRELARALRASCPA